MYKRTIAVAALAALCVVVGIASPVSVANDEAADGAKSPTVSLDDLAWLGGAWVKDAEGQFAEEVWSGGAGGAMMGMFRWIVDGQTFVYELLVIREREGSVELLLRHFTDELVAWESRTLVFEVAEIGAQRVVFLFDGDADHANTTIRIEYAREGEALTSDVWIKSDTRDDRFVLELVRK